MKISLDLIDPNPAQPRREFDINELEHLGASMQDHGQLQPIVVEKAGDRYTLIAGERRTRAARLIGWKTIEATVMPGMNGTGQRERLVLALTENLQRADMSPLEKSRAFQDLIDQGYTRIEVAGMVNLTPSSIGRYLDLLRLPDEIQGLIEAKRLPFETNGLNALQSIQDPAQQLQVARVAAAQSMSGLGIARLVKRMAMGSRRPAKQRPAKTTHGEALTASGGHWNMIAQLGKRPADKRLCAAAEETCKECPLYEYANGTNCKDCPAVDLLRRLA